MNINIRVYLPNHGCETLLPHRKNQARNEHLIYSNKVEGVMPQKILCDLLTDTWIKVEYKTHKMQTLQLNALIQTIDCEELSNQNAMFCLTIL